MLKEPLIATTDNISMHPISPLRGKSFSLTAAARACRDYFDWHPVMGGFALLVACAIAVTGAFCLSEAIPTAGGWAICTPLNGVMLAILLMSRRKLWPFLLLGYILALSEGTALAGATRRPDFLEISGNAVELLLAAFTLPPYRNLKQWLLEPRLLRAFTGYALILGPAIVSLTTGLRAAGTAGAVADLHASFWQRARIVGTSEALGIALGTALVLVLCNRQTYHLFRWRALPSTLSLFALLLLTTWFAFGPFSSAASDHRAIYLPIAVLIAMAFFLGLRGAILGTSGACVMMSAFSAHGSFAAGNVPPLLAQSCIALAVLTVFPLSVTLFNRSELEQRVKDYQSELDKLKSIDRLTGIANRRRFDLVLTREWQRATRDPKSIALLMIDTDFFDLYNEHYGHHAGDECLRLIASKLADQPHRAYDLVSRFDGGRFSVLLPGASGDAVNRIAEEFRAEIAALEWPHERSQFGRVTVSIGWASMTPETDLQPDLLIGAAEAALNSAKKKGKNRVEGFTSPVVAINGTTR